MKVGISLLSSDRTLLGIQVKKSIEPTPSETEMAFQPIVIITIGFVFGYIDVIFNNGNIINMKDAIDEFDFQHIGSIDGEKNEDNQ